MGYYYSELNKSTKAEKPDFQKPENEITFHGLFDGKIQEFYSTRILKKHSYNKSTGEEITQSYHLSSHVRLAMYIILSTCISKGTDDKFYFNENRESAKNGFNVSDEYFARKINTSTSTIQKNLVKLEESGLIIRDTYFDHNTGKKKRVIKVVISKVISFLSITNFASLKNISRKNNRSYVKIIKYRILTLLKRAQQLAGTTADCFKEFGTFIRKQFIKGLNVGLFKKVVVETNVQDCFDEAEIYKELDSLYSTFKLNLGK